jgi:putative inorganic carbon (HCO3(-)) transporter
MSSEPKKAIEHCHVGTARSADGTFGPTERGGSIGRAGTCVAANARRLELEFGRARTGEIATAVRENTLAASLGVAFFLIPLYPAFITLTAAPMPGVTLLPRTLTLAILALVAAVAASWAALLLTSPRRPLPTVLPLAALPGAALVAAAFGLDPRSGALFIAILLGGVMWHATILRFFREPHVATAIFWSYIVSGALASLVAMVLLLTKTPSSLYTIGHGRAIGTFVLPGELAGYLIIYVPVAFALARTTMQPALRAVAWIGLALASSAFFLTFSRAGWAGMASAIALYVLLRRRRNGARYAVAIVGVASVVVAFLFNAHHDPSENFTRLSIWQAAFSTIVRFPLTGVGPFDFSRVYSFVRIPGGEPAAFHGHSVLLTIAAETGVVGIAALLFGWWRFAVELRRRLRAGSPSARIAVAVTAGLAGTWVQGLVDTVSVVIFALWLPFMALALATASDDAPDVARRAGGVNARRSVSWRLRLAFVAAAALVALPLAFVQIASMSIFASAASPASLAAHLARGLGAQMYASMERIAPLPFVEAVLAEDALQRGDDAVAVRHAERVPAGPIRSELQARAALEQGRTADAMSLYVDAGDDVAIHVFALRYADRGRVHDAYELERRIRDRLASAETRPNALAESWWRLGLLAQRLGNSREALEDADHAVALAPYNTKYLIDAGLLAVRRGDADAAASLFARASEIDPADADALAGQGIAAFLRRDLAEADRLASRADAINPHATVALLLRQTLAQHGAGPAAH